MKQDQTALLYGQVASALPREQFLQELAATGLPVEMRESCHFVEGHYIRIRVDSYLVLERTDGGLYLIHGDADTPSDLLRDAEVLSAALCRLGLRHSMEVYDTDDALAGFVHWRWPDEETAGPGRPRD